MRERFAGLRVLRSCRAARHIATPTRRPQRPPYAGAVFLSRLGPRAPSPGPASVGGAAKGMICPETKALGGARKPGNPDLYRLPNLT